MQQEDNKLDPRELEVRIRTIVDQRNSAMDTISVLNGQLVMAREEIERLRKALDENSKPKSKKISELATAQH